MNEEDIEKRFEEVEKRLGLLENLSKHRRLVDEDEATSNLFEKQDENIIVTKISGEDRREKTQNIVLLTLLGYKQKLGEVEVHTSKLRENVALHTVPLENFGTHVKDLIPQSIIKKGKKGSNKVTYRLTTFGEAKAKKILKDLEKNEKSE